MSPAAYFILLASFLRDCVERRRARQYISRYTPFPLPSPSFSHFNTSDVSIIVPTVSFEPSEFTRALVSWLSNRPLEIIVVTISAQRKRTQALLDTEPVQAAMNGAQLHLLTREAANKREQLVRGIKNAKGRIIALVDDDSFWQRETLVNLLAPFEVPDVGLVGGPVDSYVPPERQSAAVITPWEVAALRSRSKRLRGNKAFYGSDGSTNFTVSGATMLLRAAILRDTQFQDEFVNETFMGKRMNSGDDSFITRWVLFQHLREDRKGEPKLRLGMQITSEATVLTGLIPDKRFGDQLKRCLRTGLRYRLTCLFWDPGLTNFWHETPYMCYKMVEGMCNPFLTVLWYYSFFTVLGSHPLVALAISLYYLCGSATSYLEFVRQFPYARRNIWAAVLLDQLSMVFDWYSWVTLAHENWASRDGVDAASSGMRVNSTLND